MKLIPLVLLLCLCGCLNKIPAVKEYQIDATKHCLEHHSAEACKPATECVHNQYGDCTAETK